MLIYLRAADHDLQRRMIIDDRKIILQDNYYVNPIIINSIYFVLIVPIRIFAK